MLLGSLLLTGCGGNKTSALPGPYWFRSGPVRITLGQRARGHAVNPGPSPAMPPGFEPPPGIIPRSAWARLDVARPREIFAMNGVRRITVHHDGMPPATLMSSRQVAGRIEQIRQSHVAGRGWADLGYHYVIDPTGRVWEGRSTRWQGAHVKDQNENNLGILVLGNFDVQLPTPSALASLDKFLATQMQRYRVSMGSVADAPGAGGDGVPGPELAGVHDADALREREPVRDGEPGGAGSRVNHSGMAMLTGSMPLARR